MRRLIDANDLLTVTDIRADGTEFTYVSYGTIEEAPTVEAIPKAEYEARLKTDMVAMLTKLKEEFEKLYPNPELSTYYAAIDDCSNLTQQKIDALREGKL